MRHRHKIGTVDREGVFIEVEYPIEHGNRQPDKPELSICADIRRSGHCVQAGQAFDPIRRVATHGTPAKDWPPQRIFRLLAIWDKWHLNGLRAGCQHQRALGWTDYDKHPSEPCPTCGYEYGTDWLYEPLPQDVIDFIQPLVSED